MYIAQILNKHNRYNISQIADSGDNNYQFIILQYMDLTCLYSKAHIQWYIVVHVDQVRLYILSI